MPQIRAAAPEGLEMKLDFDQSVFVRAAVANVVKEAVISRILVSLMILLFLGSWRNTVIVSTSIPLSIFAGIVGLFLTGNSINLMTLGGLALAIGLLVDNATVTIENIHRNQTLGKPLTVAILDGTSEVIQPLTVATLAICIVFFPVVLLVGAARFLFIPLAVTVVLCMLASYVLSFTVVPAFARFLLAGQAHSEPRGVFGRVRPWLRPAAEWLWPGACRDAAASGVHPGLHGRPAGDQPGGRRHAGDRFLPLGGCRHHQAALPRAGGNPAGGHREARAGSGGRSAQIIPADELETINDIVGVPLSYNLAFVPSDNVGGMDAEILIQLKPGHHPSIEYIRKIRATLPDEFPGSQFYFQTADIVSQVLNFGLSAPIDVQIQDVNFDRAYAHRAAAAAAAARDPGRGGCASRAGAGLPGAAGCRGPAARRQVGRLAAGCRQQHAGRACFQLAGGAEFFPQSAEQRELQRRGDAADQPDQQRRRPDGDSRQPAGPVQRVTGLAAGGAGHAAG